MAPGMLKILIADDEEEAINVLSLIFEDMNFQVIAARDGIEAYDLAEKERPDVVLSDYSMPKLNGVELYRKIKATPDICHIPFILVSGAAPADIYTDVPVFFRKPFALGELLERIKLLTGT
jgi:CheY-like chemotaxis protein